MIRKLIALGVGGAAALAAMTMSAEALAQTAVGDRLDGEGVKFIFSADRMFGLNWSKHKIVNEYPPEPGVPGTEDEFSYSQTSFSLLWPTTNGYQGYPNIAAIPRLSFDAKVFMGLTVGGSMGVMVYNGTYAQEKNRSGGPLDADDDYSGTAFVLAPRVGWVMMFTDLFGLWPRLSLNYYTAKTETTNVAGGNKITNKYSVWGMGTSIEVPLILAPTQHFAFTAGPVFDWYPFGKHDHEMEPPQPATPYDLKETRVSFINLGFTFGLLGWF